MKVSLNWISTYCDIRSIIREKWARELAHFYSIHTAEIEWGGEAFASEDRIIVGKVVSSEPHANSDHLNVVQVDLWTLGKKQIVCGAANVSNARYVAVATVGSVLSEDFVIKNSVIRGVESDGMICSEDELGFQEERSAGIMQLEKYFDESVLELQLGKPFFQLGVSIPGPNGDPISVTISDIIFEIDNKFITNRPDLFSILGNAREFSALFDLDMKPFVGNTSLQSKEPLQVKIETDNVLAYRLVKFENVEAAPTPLWMSLMLRKSDVSSKFDLVDITNYIMTELGQPMHVFDADKITGNVTVRQARTGEKILALDGKTYELCEKDMVIADDVSILAIAGVIGGMDSAVSLSTRNVYFESACFHPTSIRLTALRIGCRTDASTRFEKSLDPLLTESALLRTFDLLAFLGKNTKSSRSFCYLDSSRLNHVKISFEHAFIARKLGVEIPTDRVQSILQRLGFSVNLNGSTWNVEVPSWRATKDISIKEDLVEEIGRVYGYELVKPAPIAGFFSIATRSAEIELRDHINGYFTKNGLYETYNYSFSNTERDAKIGIDGTENAIGIQNAFNVEYTLMRRSLIPGLLSAASANIKTENSFAFYEIGKIFSKKDEAFTEKRTVAGVFVNRDLTSITEILDGFAGSILKNRPFTRVQSTDLSIPYVHPNKSGTYFYGDMPFIRFGYLHPQMAREHAFDTDNVVVFEFDFQMALEFFRDFEYAFSEISKYQKVEREINFVFDEKMSIGDVARKIESVDPLISELRVVDIFRHKEKIGSDKKSVTYSYTLQSNESTLSDDQTAKIQESIIEHLKKDGILLRS